MCKNDRSDKYQNERVRLVGMSKYIKGDVIETLEELDKQEFIYYKDKVYHYGWWGSWQYRMLVNLLKNKRLYKAIKKEELS